MILKVLLCSLLLLRSGSVEAQEVMQPVTLAAALESGQVRIVVDVRSLDEWNAGHVANATLVEDLATAEFPTIELLAGCETCTLAVMCRTGSRAAEAITRLQTEYGFSGTIYNALGVSQWEAQGLPLVVDVESKIPSCSTNNGTTPGACPTGVAMIQNADGEFIPQYSLTALPTVPPTVAPVAPTPPTIAPVAPTPAETPTPQPVGSAAGVQGESTVDRAQEAESSTTKQWVVGTTTMVGMVLLSLGSLF